MGRRRGACAVGNDSTGPGGVRVRRPGLAGGGAERS